MESKKRQSPRVVAVTHMGIRYAQMNRAMENGFTQSGGIIEAIDVATGARLWSVQLSETLFDSAEEQDVQEIYISELKIDLKKNVLQVKDERKRQWEIRLIDHVVTPIRDIDKSE